MNRELDALIAEKVMGWSNKTPKGNVSDKNWYGSDYGKYGYITKINNWRPSSDISNAWEVVKKLKISITPQEDSAPNDMKYLAEIDDRYLGGELYEQFSHSAPHAICLLAMKYVSKGVKA